MSDAIGPKAIEHDCDEKGCYRNRIVQGMYHDFTPEQEAIIEQMLKDAPIWQPEGQDDE